MARLMTRRRRRWRPATAGPPLRRRGITPAGETRQQGGTARSSRSRVEPRPQKVTDWHDAGGQNHLCKFLWRWWWGVGCQRLRIQPPVPTTGTGTTKHTANCLCRPPARCRRGAVGGGQQPGRRQSGLFESRIARIARRQKAAIRAESRGAQ